MDKKSFALIQIVFEAMHWLQWQEFRTWLQKHDKPINYAMLVGSLGEIRRAFHAEKFNKLRSNPEFKKFFRLYGKYSEDSNGPMKVFWNTYLEMVATLMNFIRATREGNWELHLDSEKKRRCLGFLPMTTPTMPDTYRSTLLP